MNVDFDKIFKERYLEQCRIGCEWLYEYVEQHIQPKIYLEIGCAKLGTFFMHQHLLPDNGLAIGVDERDSPNWDNYKSPNSSETALIKGDSCSSVVIEKVKEVLEDRKIDFLFIDGDHSVEAVKNDWNNYSPLVGSGGIIAFHDYDYSAFARGVKEGQGAAWVSEGLRNAGRKIEVVPVGTIGVAFTRID